MKIERALNPPEQDVNQLIDGLTAALPEGMPTVTSFGFFIRDDNKKILAGAAGDVFFGSINTKLLWVFPEMRNLGHGTELMNAVENLAKENHCRFVTVNTYNFQALPFYLKLGYEIEFERKGYLQDAVNYFLRKDFSI